MQGNSEVNVALNVAPARRSATVAMATTATHNAPADSVENGKTQATFDGGWKKAKISEADYMKAFSDADAAYSRMLDILIAQLKTSGT